MNKFQFATIVALLTLPFGLVGVNVDVVVVYDEVLEGGQYLGSYAAVKTLAQNRLDFTESIMQDEHGIMRWSATLDRLRLRFKV